MPSALSTEELDVLFDAVRARLRISVGVGLAATAEPSGPTAVRHAFSTVLECADALDKLQALLALQRVPRQSRDDDKVARHRATAWTCDQTALPQ